MTLYYIIALIYFILLFLFYFSIALRSIRILASYLSKSTSYEVALSALENLGDEAGTNFQSSAYYLILATLHAYGDNIKEALIVTERQSTLELLVLI